ncbi:MULTISPECIES: GntR family transcriptional regulator [unclassified Pseudonocardia]|uniref:UTRA domain-containing protein n=1 Tax=unclassified Pseudonocardia TaxID=2619320 RepID=UPI00094AA3A3|nr:MULTISPECIES: GntR family transcriptional regulator [unclassified Pseudonocardia]
MSEAKINPHSGVPLWRQVADGLLSDIRARRLDIGDRVDGYREIATKWGVGPSTALAALNHLRNSGVISSDRGQAAKVLRRPLITRRMAGRYTHNDDRSPISADLDRDSVTSAPTGVVTTEAASRTIARRLGIAEGDAVSRVDYLWVDDTGPIQRSTQWEPLSVTKGTTAEIPPPSGDPHVIARMDAIGVTTTHVNEQYSARMPTLEESEELEMSEGVPVFFVERTHLAGETPVETADISIRGDRTVISVDHPVGE